MHTVNDQRYYDTYKINSNLKYDFNERSLGKIIAILNQASQTMTSPMVRTYLFVHH